MACFGVWSSMESAGLTDCSVVRLPTSWPSGSSTLAFCSTHRMQTHKHILGRRAGYSAQRHHSTSFCRLTSLQKARSPCGAAYPVGRQGSRQPQKAPIGKILQQSTYAFASFPRTAKQQKTFPCRWGERPPPSRYGKASRLLLDIQFCYAHKF